MPIDPGAAVVAARKALSMARDDLDQAVAETPEIEEIDGVETIASPGLLALLLRAVKAKNHLDDVVLSAKR